MATALETTPSDLSERTTPSLGSDDTDADAKRAPQTLYLKKHRVPALPTLQTSTTDSQDQKADASELSVFDRFSSSDLQAFLGEFVQAKIASYGPKNASKETKGPYAKSVAKRRALDDSQVTYKSVLGFPKVTPHAPASSSEKRKKADGDGEPPLKLA